MASPLYKSVTEQAGVYAGNQGYDVTVGKETKLTGAVIASDASADKNALMTGTLVKNDIINEAYYSASSKGITLSPDKINKFNPLGIDTSLDVPVSGSASNTTHSAISKAKINVARKSDIENINYDVDKSFRKLESIFDKAKVEERLALANSISKEGYKFIGDLAVTQQSELIKKSIDAEKMGDNVKAETYRAEAKKWEDGGSYKVALHSVLGGVISKLAGGNASTGVKSAGVNEVIQNELGKLDNPLLHKVGSLLVGKLVSKSNLGGTISENASKYNYLTHDDQVHLLKDYQDYKNGQISYDEFVRKLAWYNRLMWYEKEHPEIYNTHNATSDEIVEGLSGYISIDSQSAFTDVMN